MAESSNDQRYLAESRTTLLIVFYAIPIFLELLSTGLRLLAKIKTESKKHLAFDDYLMIWATTVAVAECTAGLIYGAPYGLGRHLEAVSIADLRMFMMGNYIFSHFYNVAIASTKLSVLALYYRIFIMRTFRSFIIGTAVFVTLWMITMEVVLGFECRPIQAWWYAVDGTCLDLVAFAYFTNITNLVADMWIFTMPIPVILRLKANSNKKLGLVFLFSVGLGTCGISAARLAFVFSQGSADITWDEVPLGILSAWEPCGGILCANLPIIYGAFFRTTNPNKSSSAAPNSTQQSNQSSHREWVRLNNSSISQGEYASTQPLRSLGPN
ncbi:putative Integral membrane protein [Seiridium cardinale]|uniref:Integral membrane protein n=1 Tax=Seiridium cardinale TaxID=138064 RepID=A0ABR2XM49_9PEZI